MLEQVGRAQRMARDGLDDTRRAIAALRGDALPGPALLDRLIRDIAAGLSNQEIATVLFVSEATVKTHINHIFTKTGLRDRAQLVGYAFRHGLATPD
jgi:ATP/maltotriose-dependent transcriptional regulator MalT